MNRLGRGGGRLLGGSMPRRRGQARRVASSGGLEDGAHEGSLPAQDAARLVSDAVGGEELGVHAEGCTVGLVLGERREGEQREGVVAGALGRQEVAVVGPSARVDQPYPGP